MTRRVISAMALGMVLVTGAQAQKFKESSYSGYNSTMGIFTSGAPSAFSNNVAFQIWCVDQNHSARTSSSEDVYVSSLASSSAMDNTRLGAGSASNSAAQTKYTKAAWIANSMGGGDVNDKQYAIWAIIHGKQYSNSGGTGYCEDIGGSCDRDDIADYISDATAGIDDIDQSEWYVITDKDSWDRYEDYGHQEFIARCQVASGGCDGFDEDQDQGQTPNPEPATMSLLALGLAGMAGSSLRRRKK